MFGLIFATPFLLLLVVFALSNRELVQFGLWPTDLTVGLPVSLAVLGAGAVFFILGALVVGITSAAQRRRARRAERRVQALELELEDLRPKPVRGTALQVAGR